MEFPKEIAILAVEKYGVHCDEHSKEASTGIVKRKYKLAGNKFPGDGGILFWIYTSQQETYPRDKTVEFNGSDYEWCKYWQLKKGTSRVCIDRVDYLTEAEIAAKISHHQNGFKKVAVMKKASFDRLAALVSKVKLSNKVSLEKMKQIVEAVVDNDVQHQTILKNMGL